MKKSFSLIELIIVIIVIGILAASMKFSLANSSLNQAVDQIINHIRYTQQLALRDDKYQAFPLDSSAKEGNRSKYWFKQWWQIRFSNKNNEDCWYEVFTDLPTGGNYNFEGLGYKPNNSNNWSLTYAKNPLNGKYLIGKCDDSSNYPTCLEADKKLNLTVSYGIKVIKYENFFVKNNYSPRLLFDSYGKPYLRESDSDGDNGDINPYDNDKRMPLTKIAKITLCLDDNCEQNKSICIYPETGYVKSCD